MAEVATVWVLLVDGDMTMRSQPEPTGVAVRSKEEAERWLAEPHTPSSRAIAEVGLFDSADDGFRWRYPDFYKNKI